MDKYLLRINEPCSENWESMTTAEKGKFCNQCNKTVFDFTTATDAEIVKHIEAMKGELFCGRFEENQLDRWIERSDIKTSNPRLYKFLISFMLLGAAQGANAQTTPAQEKVAMQRKLDSLLNLETTKAEMGEMVCDTVRPNGINGVSNEKVIIVGGARTISNKTQQLIIIDGKKIKQKNLKKIDPGTIKEISVLKTPEAEAKYGSRGKNGVLVITTNTDKMKKKEMQ